MDWRIRTLSSPPSSRQSLTCAQYQIPDTWILNHHTLDGYLFLRFLKISVVICLVGCLITWPVLFPINITGGGTAKQLDLLTMSNIENNYYSK